MGAISSLVCAVTAGVIAFACYTQSKKCKADGKEGVLVCAASPVAAAHASPTELFC